MLEDENGNKMGRNPLEELSHDMLRRRKFHIAEEMIQDGQWDIINALTREAGRQMARRMEETIFQQEYMRLWDEESIEGRLYREQS